MARLLNIFSDLKWIYQADLPRAFTFDCIFVISYIYVSQMAVNFPVVPIWLIREFFIDTSGWRGSEIARVTHHSLRWICGTKESIMHYSKITFSSPRCQLMENATTDIIGNQKYIWVHPAMKPHSQYILRQRILSQKRFIGFMRSLRECQNSDNKIFICISACQIGLRATLITSTMIYFSIALSQHPSSKKETAVEYFGSFIRNLFTSNVDIVIYFEQTFTIAVGRQPGNDTNVAVIYYNHRSPGVDKRASSERRDWLIREEILWWAE